MINDYEANFTDFLDRFEAILFEELMKAPRHDLEGRLIEVYDTAMNKAGFDYEAESEKLLTEYIHPTLSELQGAFEENDEKALEIYREAGLEELKVQWRNFETAKLNFIQKRKIKKLAEGQERLGDAQLHLVVMTGVIYNHRSDLEEKYGTPKLLLVEGR